MVPVEADGFIKGSRFFDIGDRQVHENLGFLGGIAISA
jgi:hypothetical protein